MEKAVLAFLAIFCVGFTVGLGVIFLRVRKLNRGRRARIEEHETWYGHGFTLVTEVNEDTNLVDGATLADVSHALDSLSAETQVTLISPHGGQLRADGTRAAFRIYFEALGSPSPMLVGRADPDTRRGKAALSDDRILVTPLEIWSRDDGLHVFSTFMSGAELSLSFTLRDPTATASALEIRAAIGRA
jgi:hypothetical protein